MILDEFFKPKSTAVLAEDHGPKDALAKLANGQRVTAGDIVYKSDTHHVLDIEGAAKLNARYAQQLPINITQAEWDDAVKYGGLDSAQVLDRQKGELDQGRDYNIQRDKDERAKKSGDYSQQDIGASKVDRFGRSRPTPMAFSNLGRPMDQDNPAQAQKAYAPQDRPAQPQSASNTSARNGWKQETGDEVKFFIDSEPAYYAVMDRFGDHIEFRGDDLVAPQRLWSAIQQTAGDAGGAADIAGLEDDRMGTDNELDEQGVAEGPQEDAKFTPRLQIRSQIETALDQYLDPEKVAGAYTDIQYYKHDGKVYVEVLFNYTDGQKIGPKQRKQFLVNKDFTLTPIKKQGVAEGREQDYLSQVPNLTWKPVSRSVWNTIQDEGLDEEQDAPKHTDWIMASLTISPEDSQALQAFDSDAIEDFNRFDIHLKSRHPGLTDLIDYDNGTVTIVKPSQMQGVAEGSRTPQDWEVKSAVWRQDKQGVYLEPQDVKSHFVRADRSSRAEEKAKREYEPGRGTWEIHPRGNKQQDVAEGAPELLKKEMPTHRHAEKLLAQNGVSKDDPDYHHHLSNTIKHLRQFGNIDLINKSDEQGMAEGSAADGSVNYTLGHTPDAEYVYSIYRDGQKEGTYHSVDQAREIMGNMKLTSPNREYKIKRGARNKMAGPASQLPEQDMAEGHGNYAGDRPVNLGGVSMKKIQIGDTVRYIDQKAQVVDMSRDREHARITIPSSATTKTVLTSDLRQLGRGVSEGSDRIAANKQDRVEALENKLKAKGYARTKDSDGGEYQYRWTRDGAPTYVVNYRSGANGYAEFWKEQDMAEAGYDSGDYSNDRQSDDYGRDLVPTGSGGSRFVNHGAHDHTRGRPAKTHGFSKNLPADPFGRTAGKIPHSARPKQELDPFRELDELSPATLARYKTKAGAAATAADSAGDRKTGDRRFSGIVKATKKQFDQDAKQSAQAVHESRLRLMASIIKTQ